MRLNELFEAPSDTLAVIFGRFNPPHKGHKAAWELMRKDSSNWFVGTNASTQGPKDPLPYDVKIEAMKAVDPTVEGHLMSSQSWLTMISELYEKHPNAKLIVYTDEEWVIKTINQYNGVEGKAHGFYDYASIEHKPTPRVSSATELRAAVQAGDREAFTNAAGIDADTEIAGKAYFDLVAEYLLPYGDKAKKKKAESIDEGSLEEIDRRGFLRGIGAAALGGAGVSAAQASDTSEPKSDKMVATLVIDGETRVLDLTPKNFKDVREATKWLEKFLDDRGIDNWGGRIERGVQGSGNYQRAQISNISANLGMFGRNESASDVIAHTAKDLANPDSAKVMKHRAKRDQEREKTYQAAQKKRDDSSKDEWGDYKNEEAAGVGIITKQNTTKDVNKGTLRKMMKGYKLV